MGLQRGMRFGDIGHGIGNLLFQATYVTGCESVGIEINEKRYEMSETLFGCSQKQKLSSVVNEEVSIVRSQI